MAKKMLIDATHAEETRVVVVDGNKVEEFDFESENKRQLAGNIYLAKVTRVEPSLQAAFVDYGGNRHGFLAFSEIHPDYYQIPVADREALLEEERAYAEAQNARDEDDEKPKPRRNRRSRSRTKAATADNGDAVESSDPISGMETIDTADGDEEGMSPMERVGETPVEEPSADTADNTDDTSADGNGNGDGDEANGDDRRNASYKDSSIESVADDDDHEDIRPPRKPRPRRYKIQEVIKVRQILLVQVVKEERGNKGAALTTYLSLAGRYCVLMPNTARGGGISRKITNAADRKKLKSIANEIDVPKGAGLIVRTAGAKRTKAEIKRDYEYLQRLWEQIRELTLKSIAPAKIYEEGDLIKRSIRDLYNREIDEVMVEGERGYRIAKDFMKMIMPSHAKNVKHYVDQQPLFARYQVESYLGGMFNPTVQLKSGGYIVIGVTEALVAIDVNSGRATKEGSIEETALKTNLEAADEVARQLRLRDLAGLIVIDFIDMDERRNNAAVEKRMKERLKTDRARIQVSRISGFGLMEMSRQRLRPGMIEATTQPCPACHGTGLIRSDDNLALSILRQIEEEGVRRRSREVLVKCPVGIANFLMNQKREHVAQIEARYGLSVRIEGDPTLISPDFSLEKFKTATRAVPEVEAPVVSVDSSIMAGVDDDSTADAAEDDTQEQAEAGPQNGEGEGDDKPKKRRRRRRRRGGKKTNGGDEAQTAEANGTQGAAETEAKPAASADTAEAEGAAETESKAEVSATTETGDSPEAAAEDKPKPKRTRKPRKKKSDDDTPTSVAEAPAQSEADVPAPAEATEEAKTEAKPKRTRKPRKPKAASPEASEKADTGEQAAPTPEPAAKQESKPSTEPEPAPEPAKVTEMAEAEATTPAKAQSRDEADDKPKRRGWWSMGR
ncbi:ribonuclease E/G [Roseovarius sp. E0-M6]|uniref:ribonuclease E/G n=1 Tax=Roseovarius sp. E0-M6 TaxID=3127118 RepID=UPI00300FF4BC